MPHLPATRSERQEADQRNRVKKVMSERRFQWARTKVARRVLVVVGALLSVGIIPAFAQGGNIVGAVVTIAAFSSWGLVRISIRQVADLPERFLDERQRIVRDRAYVRAYLILGWIVGGLVTIGFIVFVFASENDAATFTTTWQQTIGVVLSITLLISFLPNMVVAWSDPGEDRSEPASPAENDAQPD